LIFIRGDGGDGDGVGADDTHDDGDDDGGFGLAELCQPPCEAWYRWRSRPALHSVWVLTGQHRNGPSIPQLDLKKLRLVQHSGKRVHPRLPICLRSFCPY
jgi:hypothetical protein